MRGLLRRSPVLMALIVRPMLRERTRTALTIAGIAVGVAVVVAIQLANQSALRAFRESVDAVAGRANYQIVPEAGLLDESLLLKLQPMWRSGLRFAPVIDLEGIVATTGQPIRILGVDLLSDLHFRDYRYATISGSHRGSDAPRRAEGKAPGRGIETVASVTRYLALFETTSVVVPAPFAREHGLKTGSTLLLDVLGHRRPLVVRGVLEAEGPATAFNGSIAIVDVAAAQENFGLAGRLTRVDLMVPDAQAEPLLAAIRRELPAGTRVERPSRRNDRVDKMLRAFRVNLFALAGVALLVGVFLVYNTVLVSILRRRREIGLVKLLGVTRGQILGGFVTEGLLFGVAGSFVGVALGVLLARGVLGLVGKTINALYVTSRPESIVLTPTTAATGMAVGILLSLAASLQPALEAAAVRPASLFRSAGTQRASRRRQARLAVAAGSCFCLAAAATPLPAIGGIAVAGYGAVLLVIIGFSLLAPTFLVLVARAGGPPLRSLFGIVGQLAARSLPASLRRTSIAAAALATSVGMMVAVALMVGSFRMTVNTWIEQTISSDLWLRPSRGLSNSQIAVFPPSILEELRRIPFVAAADPVRGRDVIYGDGFVTVGSGDFRVAGRRGSLPLIDARGANPFDRALEEKGVFVSESFSLKYGKEAGDAVELPTLRGLRTFPVTAVYRDYSNDRGTVVMDRSLYVELFEDESINTVVVYLREGTNLADARRELEKQLGPRYRAFTVSNAEVRAEVMRIFDQTFLITYALLAISVVVGVLGIVNTLSALILERRRELALLRIGGMSRKETTAMLVLESALLGLAALATGLVMGYVLSWILIHVINRQSFGWTIEFHTPVALLAVSLAVTFTASCLAGLIPSRVAWKMDLASTIATE